MKIALAAAALAAGALAAAPVALAEDSASDLRIGQAGTLVNGDVVQTWTITGLRKSTDVIPTDITGTLWEVTATNTAVAGTVIPIIPNFNARAGSDNYRVLFGVPSPQGVNPSTLPQGEKASGKLYFDIPGGVAPDRVVFNDGETDRLVWTNAPEPVAGPPSVQSGAAQSTGAGPKAVGNPAAANSAGTPATAGTPAATSQGTPAAAGTPAATSQGTPAAAGTPAATPAPAAPAAATPPAAAGTPAATSQGPPAAAGTPAATPAPAAPAAATPPAAAGTPATTTVIPSTSAGTPAG
jgi:hypothetical protein